MTAPTLSAAPSTDARIEEWRDTILDLAANVLQSLVDGGEMPDDQTLATIANATDDLRVRDCMIWAIANEHDASTLIHMSQLIATMGMTMPYHRCATLMTMTTMVEGLLGNYETAAAAVKCALLINPELFIAYATQRTLEHEPHKFHMHFRKMFIGMSYADVRHGK